MGFGGGAAAVVTFFAGLYLMILTFAACESLVLYLWSRRPVAWTPVVLVASLPLVWFAVVPLLLWIVWLRRRPRLDDDPRPATWKVLVLAISILVVGGSGITLVASA